MKKIFTLAFLMISLLGFGQSLKFIYNGTEYTHHDTINVAVENLTTNNYYYLDIVNTSSEDLFILVKKEIISFLEGSTNNFCIAEQCYDGLQSVEPLFVFSGDTVTHDNDAAFHITYKPNSQGVSVIKYLFYDQNNIADESNIIFKFVSGTSSIGNNNGKMVTSLKAYPNPATNKVTFEYNINQNNGEQAKLVVKNLMGITLYAQTIPQGENKVAVDISNYTAGVYFYSIEMSGKPYITKKLLVK
ncbi:MAG: T9SS type A sorting domain-containing protein [Bacteroidales bacterium]